MSFSVYLAGSVQKELDEKKVNSDWRKEFQSLCEKKSCLKINFLNPNETSFDTVPTEKFFSRDVYMINNSDAVIVDCVNKIGLGTAQEILIAKYFKKPVIAVSPKNSHYNRTITTEHSKSFNYKHPFLTSTADVITESFEEASTILIEHLSGKKVITPKILNNILENAIKEAPKYFKL